jgi:hypothetical protein
VVTMKYFLPACQLLVTANVPSSPIVITMMMEALGSSETSVLTRATWSNISEVGILQHSISSQHAAVASYSYIVPSSDSCNPDDGGNTFLRNVGSQEPHGVTSQKTAFFSHCRGNLKSYITFSVCFKGTVYL